MIHLCETKRLRVFTDVVKPTEHNMERTLLIAFRTDEDRPMVCATALLEMPMLEIGWYIDWIEVTTQYRREGLARELYDCISQHFTPFMHERQSGGSSVGRKFVEAMQPKAGAAT